jgi:4Fe-4S iron-sulfur cluster binding domain/DR2241 stabilising domain
MIAMADPALEHFLAQFGAKLLIGEVLIARCFPQFELRHAADGSMSAEELKLIEIPDLRAVAQTTANGSFRPLKSAPNLRRGWRARMSSPKDLGVALNHLYPGAVADWFASKQNPPPLTNYRTFTGRQTGMYRKSQLLNDEQASLAVKACCHPRFCLKRRLWGVGTLGSDPVEAKSMIPCLEPCALLLEFARTVAGLEQEKPSKPPSPAEDASPVLTPSNAIAPDAIPAIREADFGDSGNPRRRQWLLEKLGPSICSRGKHS